MTLKQRKRWALFVLCVWMPVYIGLAIWAVNWAFDRWGRAPIWAEFIIYVALGLLAVLPFRSVFRGVGRGEE